MLKLRLRTLKLLTFFIICGGLLSYLGSSIYDLIFETWFDSLEKINNERRISMEIIEHSIMSAVNRMECRMPNLPIDNPEIMKFYNPVAKIDCGNPIDDWVMCKESICFVKPEVIAKYGETTCTYVDILRTSDFDSRNGSAIVTREPYVLKASDFAFAHCVAETGYSLLFGIRDGVLEDLVHKPIAPPLYNNNPLLGLEATATLPPYINILIYGFDSLSRNAFMRKLPKSYKYLTDQLQAIVLKGYNIVGDGTPQALVPILTGYTELELPDTRKRIRYAIPVDEAYPLIWKDYEQQGYVTSFNEDMPNYGVFTYRLKGFAKQPVHHYLRTFYMASLYLSGYSKDYCIGHQPDHQIMLNYTKNFMSKYKDTPKFIFSFHGGLSHDSINLIGAADDDLLHWLTDLNDGKFLENTILIMMSDHGNRFSSLRATLQGKQEERLPFFSFVFPKTFKERFPTEFKNFMSNSERLTTPFDIHATLKHILDLQSLPTDSNEVLSNSMVHMPTSYSTTENNKLHNRLSYLASHRAISLFLEVPANRSCYTAYIEPHWCACLNWQTLNVDDPNHGIVFKAASAVLNTINSATLPFRGYCARLELKHINWALHLTPHQELVNFQKSSDLDGFLPEMADNYNPVVLYQIQILVVPGDSLFEASVSYNTSSLEMVSKLSEISRINKYGSQANCIYHRNPELRKYCYCKLQ